MSEEKKVVIWAPEAREELRAIDRQMALDSYMPSDEYLTNGAGDVKRLRPPRDELRLRVGDYRVFFYQLAPNSLHFVSVKHRSQAYR